MQRVGISPTIAAAVAALPSSFHRDPADRIIVASAQVLRATFELDVEGRSMRQRLAERLPLATQPAIIYSAEAHLRILPALYQLNVHAASNHRRRPLQAAERGIVLRVEQPVHLLFIAGPHALRRSMVWRGVFMRLHVGAENGVNAGLIPLLLPEPLQYIRIQPDGDNLFAARYHHFCLFPKGGVGGMGVRVRLNPCVDLCRALPAQLLPVRARPSFGL